jgi:hypothetical protein
MNDMGIDEVTLDDIASNSPDEEVQSVISEIQNLTNDAIDMAATYSFVVSVLSRIASDPSTLAGWQQAHADAINGDNAEYADYYRAVLEAAGHPPE